MNLRDILGDGQPGRSYHSPEGPNPFLTDPLLPRPLRSFPFLRTHRKTGSGAPPARYALWFALAGKDFADGHWYQVLAPSGTYRGVAVFSSRLTAIRYLSDALVAQWPEFIEIVPLSEEILAGMPLPILMDGVRETSHSQEQMP